jgi:hypothetical protein
MQKLINVHNCIFLTDVTQMIFKAAPAFMPGIAKLQNIFGFSQYNMKIVA